MALPQLPEMSHRRAARCTVASSGVSAPCAHCAKEPKSSFHECHLQIHKDHLTFSEGNWLSGKTLECRPRDSEFNPTSLQLKLLKKEIFTGSSQEKCSRVSVLYTGHVKEPGLSSVVGAPVSGTMSR